VAFPKGLLALALLIASPRVHAADVSITVDPSANRHPVSPLIYGVSFGDDAAVASRRWSIRRWGGNATTRYNWRNDSANRGADYLFMNFPNDNPDPSTGTSADHFLDANHAAGAESLVTIPTIGWAPPDTEVRWGFSQQKYGTQQFGECDINFYDGCHEDAGNGFHAGSGSPVTGNDPHDTSIEVGPSFEAAWVAHIVARLGAASQGGVEFYALDNEPMIWASEHRDVHPAPPTYDEIWGKTAGYAAAIKAADPGAKVTGPAEGGWCAYFWSGLDGCSDGPDYAAHGGMHWVDWYLQQVQAYANSHGGQRLIDYLDLHCYPQGEINNTGVAFSDDSVPGMAELRLRSIKSLYDPAYVDESWIGDAGFEGGVVRLIPRMKAWAAAVPGMKTAITEYNWGADDSPSSALAQAETFAIFGREGLDMAMRWDAPAAGSLTQDAFDLYLDYDGAGSKVYGDSVSAVSSNVDSVGAYAIRNPSATLYVLLFNKDTVSSTAAVTVAGGVPPAAHLYEFHAGRRLGAAGDVAPSGGRLTLTLPPRSATLAVLPPLAPPGEPSVAPVAPPPPARVSPRQ